MFDKHFRDITFARAYLKQLMDDGFIEPIDFEDFTDTELIGYAERFMYEQEKKRRRRTN